MLELAVMKWGLAGTIRSSSCPSPNRTEVVGRFVRPFHCNQESNIARSPTRGLARDEAHDPGGRGPIAARLRGRRKLAAFGSSVTLWDPDGVLRAPHSESGSSGCRPRFRFKGDRESGHACSANESFADPDRQLTKRMLRLASR